MTDGRRANLAAAAAIVLAGALSTVWVFLVPIFQAPDEPAHFDYAVSIYNAHRLVRVSDGRPDWIVSPYTKYLMHATNWERVAWHSSMRAPSGYGSHAYFARIDAGAPSTRRPTVPNETVSYITPYYPFGFYGLEALWMHGVSLVTGSIVAMFFAARLLCVFLTMLGLYFNYRTALNLGIPRWTSVALVAAVGFFPLTTFVSSYVQPDNLAYALVSAALFFATQLRNGKLSTSTMVSLGVSLGLLAITKYHFFLSVAIPVAALVVARLAQARLPARRRMGALVLLGLPTILMLAIQYVAVSRATGSASAVHTDLGADYIRSVLALGFGPTLGYLVATSIGAFTNCFITGGCAATFWQMVGWVDTPIVIVSPTIEVWTRAAISLATFVAAVVVIFFACRNGVRLFAVAMRGHARAALNVAMDDAVLNSYLCFAAIMIAFYVVTNNAFGVEGRQWYPYVFPAFLCFAWYAPRALRKEHGRVSGVLACLLLGYALIGSGYGTAAIVHRYYGPPGIQYVATKPPASQVTRQTDGVLWPVVSAKYHVSTRTFAFGFPAGARLLIDGSALVPGLRSVPTTVAVVLDGRTALPVLTDQYLFPVAEATHSIANGYSGFYSTFSSAGLREGAHVVSAFAKVPGSGRYDLIPPTRVFFVTNANGSFSPQAQGVLQRLPTASGSLERMAACNHGVALFAGSIDGARDGEHAVAWLLVDGRPYPARYNEADGSFVAAVPTAGLPAASRQVSAFVTDAFGRSKRIAQTARLSVSPNAPVTEYLHDPPAACADPLAQLEEA